MFISKITKVFSSVLILLALAFCSSTMFNVSVITSRFASSTAEKMDPLEGKYSVTNHRYGRKGPFKSGYLALANSKDIDSGRRINIKFPINKNILLKKRGYTKGDGAESVFISAQAPLLAAAECELLNRILSSECRVYKASAEVRSYALILCM